MDQAVLIHEQGTDDFLHRFFSPYKVPAGLTEDEIRMCVRLFPRKNKLSRRIVDIQKRTTYTALLAELTKDHVLLEHYREGFSIVFGEAALSMTPEHVAGLVSNAVSLSSDPVSPPPEIRRDPITRESFSKGVAILIARMIQLESES